MHYKTLYYLISSHILTYIKNYVNNMRKCRSINIKSLFTLLARHESRNHGNSISDSISNMLINSKIVKKCKKYQRVRPCHINFIGTRQVVRNDTPQFGGIICINPFSRYVTVLYIRLNINCLTRFMASVCNILHPHWYIICLILI